MQLILGLLTLLIFLRPAVAAESQEAFVEISNPESLFWGHNLAQTSETLPSRECSVGLQILACGLSNEYSLGLSPFIFQQYGLPNIYLRWNPERIGPYSFQISQIGDGVYRPKAYQMSKTMLWLTGRWLNEANVRGYSNLIFGYYWIDKIPFSLRRPQPSPKNLQVTWDSLVSSRLSGPYWLNTEFGILGMNETYPHFHFGGSLAYRGENFSIHFGLSFTFTPMSLYAVNAVDAWKDEVRIRQSFEEDVAWVPFSDGYSWTNEYQGYDFGSHPEIALQYQF